jgi:hypothetical protein
MKPALACLSLGLLLIGGALAGAHANRPGVLQVESEDAPPPDAVGGPRLYRATLRNTGGRPVKIRAVEASCGCAKPTVSPTTVPPGGHTVVETEVLRPPGSGSILLRLKVHTDNPRRPSLELSHQIIDARKVPYLSGIGGELTFRGDVSRGATRDLYVTTVEPPGGTIIPRPRCDLPFLEIAYVATSNSDPTEDGSIVRAHRYLLRAAEDPPGGTTVGEVSVEDPWNAGRVEKTNVILQVRRGEPEHITARASPAAAEADAHRTP